MEVSIIPEFEEATTYIGDFPDWKLFLVNHRDIIAFALVSGEKQLDGRKKNEVSERTNAREKMAKAMRNAMMDGFNGDRVDVALLGWGNPSATAIYFLAKAEDERRTPKLTSYGLESLEMMTDEEISARIKILADRLANENVSFVRKF